jgi:protein TonB
MFVGVKIPERFADATAAGTSTLGNQPAVMKIADIREALPQTPSTTSTTTVPAAEQTAETITAAETPSVARTVSASEGAEDNTVSGSGVDESDFLPSRLVSQLPRFSDEELKERVRYPPLAQRAGIEGTVYLEIFVDREGAVRTVTVLWEEPASRGFGDAAAQAFIGLRGTPALANGVEVAVRYRYPVRFSLR